MFPNAYNSCNEFLRHKTFLINPLLLKEKGITINKCYQQPGEFVVTMCGGYHSGFNYGFNCAEAVNFAVNNWITLGKEARFCKCKSDTVIIDMEQFVNNLNDIPLNQNEFNINNNDNEFLFLNRKSNRSKSKENISENLRSKLIFLSIFKVLQEIRILKSQQSLDQVLQVKIRIILL